MGEAKTRSRSRAQILATAERCIYCETNNNLSIEHMPPRGMFNKDRPSGWEFASCKDCNNGTSGSDAVAQFFAKCEIIAKEGWKLTSNQELLGALRAKAPGVLEEIFGGHTPWQDTLVNRNGLLHRTKIFRANGPVTKRHLDVFASKAAMASFYELVGRPLKMSGSIFTEWHLNGGMPEEKFSHIVSIMPQFAQLTQGQKISGRKFNVRFNTNREDIVAALLSFHDSLFITVIVTDNDFFIKALQEIVSGLPSSLRPTINLTRPGLLKLRSPANA